MRRTKDVQKTRALLLGASSALNLKVLYCLYPIAESHVMVSRNDNMALKSRHAWRKIVTPIDEQERTSESIDKINKYCADNEIDVIVPGDMDATAFVAENQDMLEGVAVYPSSGSAVLDAMHDKWSFAESLSARGISIPKTELIASVDDLDPEKIERVGFPMIVKPLDAESSHGVVRIENSEQLHRYLRGGVPYSEPPLIMQEFIDGDDIDISILADEGRILASAVQYWSPEKLLVFIDEPEMHEMAEAIVGIFGFKGAAHFDMRRGSTNGKMYVLECNPRFWYTMPAAMWAGLNFVEAGINVALGRECERMSAARGAYRLPSDLARSFVNPAKLMRTSMANWRGFLQPLLDPVPHLHAARLRRLTG